MVENRALQSKRYSSLQTKTAIVFVVLIIVPFLSWFLYQNYQFRQTLKKEIISNTYGTLENQNAVLEDRIQRSYNFLLDIALAKQTHAMLRAYVKSPYSSEMYFARREFDDYINHGRVLYGVKAVTVALSDGNSIIYQNGEELYPKTLEKPSPWYQEVRSYESSILYSGISQKESTLDNFSILRRHPKNYLTFDISKTLFDISGEHPNGAVQICVNTEDLFKMQGPSNRVVAYQEEGHETLYLYKSVDFPHQQELVQVLKEKEQENALSFEHTFGKEKMIVIRTKPNAYGWRVLSVTPYQTLLQEVTRSTAIGFFVTGICLVLFSLFLVQLFAKLITPMQTLINQINQEEYSFEEPSSRFVLDEGTAVRDTVLSIIRVNREIEEIYHDISLALNKSRSKQLQLQMNPHFIYNTLSAIQILADTGAMKEVSTVIVSFSSLLHANMDKTGEFTTVAQEIQTAQHYIQIQDIVYEGKIAFTYAFDEGLSQCRVPNFILQPIVENAVIHGVAWQGPPPSIHLESFQKENNLYFTVSDNGPGISPDVAAELKSLLSGGQQGLPTNGFGIISVHQRIQLYYGRAYGLSLETKPGDGTRFTFRLPLEYYGEDENEKHHRGGK